MRIWIVFTEQLKILLIVQINIYSKYNVYVTYNFGLFLRDCHSDRLRYYNKDNYRSNFRYRLHEEFDHGRIDLDSDYRMMRKVRFD